MLFFPKKKKKVILGMSGGVDSSVSAWLLKKQGYEVVGVFMKNFDPLIFLGKENLETKKSGCHWYEDQEDARAVAEKLKINFEVWNFEKQYYQEVMGYFLQEYKNGRTPNPDVMCNRQIKFGAFFEKAMRAGADYIATGHYARVKKKGGRYILLKGKDLKKDQSYFLSAVKAQALSKTIFPLGNLTKTEVRALAQKINLPSKDKPDSQGICFVGEVDLKDFLSQHISDVPGDIIDLDTRQTIGRHDGLSWYTIGQRKGMKVGGTGIPLYVAGKNIKKNELYVVKGNYNPKLFTDNLKADNLIWINDQPRIPNKLKAKIRYRQPDQTCLLEWQEEPKVLRVKFAEPQRAVTPGQSIVFYDNDICLGSGIILNT